MKLKVAAMFGITLDAALMSWDRILLIALEKEQRYWFENTPILNKECSERMLYA